eukprot:TRINITY_DN101_c0_g2_i1.p1 TRINITY_DN101_c0_g2~~TRINITY_DN101_c0_g2_i1.p1  ORF type:complete len:1026 (-),score=378.99 TRINITY_DN101_c0_g2_i1:76-3153(-)
MNENKENLEYDDKWSRLIHAIGKEALMKMQQAKILVSGLKGLGMEIAKNVVLMGIRKCTIYDNEKVEIRDLSSQFFLREGDVGKIRSEVVRPRLQELNDGCNLDVAKEINDEILLQHTIVIMTNNKSLTELKRVSELCHEKGIAFICTDTFGLWGYGFADFGKEHIITDKNGEPATEGYILALIKDENNQGYITSQTRHNLEDGDIIKIEEVEGYSSLNGNSFKVEVKGPFDLAIGDLSKYEGNYVKGGMYILQKLPTKHSYNSMGSLLAEPIAFDKVVTLDWAYMGENAQNVVLFQALLAFREKHNGDLPRSYNDEDTNEVLELAKKINDETEKTELNIDLLKRIIRQSRGDLNCMAAFFGGILAQEAIKSQSGKYVPLDQFFFYDAVRNCLPEKELDLSEYKEEGTRYDGQICVLGKTVQHQLENLKYFLVGAGAIGCEMLKNFCMIGLSAGKEGLLKIVDLDIIEISNLNRQFLYRPHDVKKPKAECSARAAKVMNPNINIQTFTTKVCPETEDVYNDEYWNGLDGVCNALDNLQARLYVDSRCVFYRKSLLESGTLGTKGNTQVIVPGLTQYYGESRDPEPTETARCLLHSFPSNIDMCLQWARELIFEGEFVSYIESFNNYLKKADYIDTMEEMQLRKTLDNFKKILPLPKSFDDCIVWARTQFQQYYNHDPKQLIHNFPLDKKDNNGTPFWTGTRRPPISLEFDAKNDDHANFVVSATFLRAYTCGIIDNELKPGDIEDKVKHILSVASKVTFPPFVPAKGLKIATNEEEEKELQKSESSGTKEELLKILPPRESTKPLVICDFEKDDDRNFHIDFIHSSSNLKAAAYSIKLVTRLQAKLIAGRIVPAIVTTTASVAGLVIFELYKLLRKDIKLENFRNSFFTLALDIFQISEPMPPRSYTFKGEKKTSWDLIKFQEGDLTVNQFLEKFKEKFGFDILTIEYNTGSKDKEGKDVIKLLYKSFGNEDIKGDFDKKLSELVSRHKKGGLSKTDNCFPLIVVLDSDDEDNEDECPPVYLFFR